MKRILFVHSSDELYGSDIVLLQLVSGLDRRVYEPIVVLPTDLPYEGRLSASLEEIGVMHYAIRMGVIRRRYLNFVGVFQYAWYLASGIRQILEIVRKDHVDLIHSNTSAVFGGAIAAHFCHLPHVWHVHEILTNPTWLSKLVRRIIVSNADCVVCISDAVAEHLDPNWNPMGSHKNGIRVIRDAVDCIKFSPQANGNNLRSCWGVSADTVIVGVVGRISYLKGQDIFIEAAAQAIKEFPKLHFVIVGDPVPGDESRLGALEARADQLGLANTVSFLHHTSDMPNVMCALDILVSPSIFPEALGLVVLEAMACARPVVVAAHGGPLEVVQDGKTGLHFPPRDVDALTQAIVELALDPNRRNKMGQLARQHILDYFSLEGFAQQFHQLYVDLLESMD